MRKDMGYGNEIEIRWKSDGNQIYYLFIVFYAYVVWRFCVFVGALLSAET
jgi:hypothetical protein